MVAEWQKSIINHLYWCVSSTPANDSELIKAKWLSLDKLSTTFTMFIEDMARSFLSVHMVDWDGETETGNGYKDVSDLASIKTL